jgi:DNA-directed RNA polymerase subunit RPC12/RpoP
VTECNHAWIFVKDWYGDPNVIDGTADCSFYRCSKCGEEVTEEPEGYENPDELNADDERDRRIDDALTGDDRYDE